MVSLRGLDAPTWLPGRIPTDDGLRRRQPHVRSGQDPSRPSAIAERGHLPPQGADRTGGRHLRPLPRFGHYGLCRGTAGGQDGRFWGAEVDAETDRIARSRVVEEVRTG